MWGSGKRKLLALDLRAAGEREVIKPLNYVSLPFKNYLFFKKNLLTVEMGYCSPTMARAKYPPVYFHILLESTNSPFATILILPEGHRAGRRGIQSLGGYFPACHCPGPHFWHPVGVGGQHKWI